MASIAQFQKTSALAGALAPLIFGMASPAFAQTAPAPATAPSQTQAPDAASSADKADKDDNAIIVTGTLFKRRIDQETASPLTVLTANDLARRAVTNVSDAISTISANGSGGLPNGFSAAGGAFANGAAGASLRGLTTDSTLVLFDGLRAAYYPLSDDGVRNFVDTNTIPDAIVDRIDVLKDGASSTYGADAVAGVINVIIKKQIQGFHGLAETGISQRGDGAERRFSATYGYGDLVNDGWNFYVNAEYEHDSPIFLRNRSYPYNSSDKSRIAGTDADGNTVHGVNADVNGLDGNGVFLGTVGQTPVTVVRRADADGNFIDDGVGYRLLNTSAGCRGLPTVNVTAAGSPTTLCTLDPQNKYGEAQQLMERLGGTLHFTKQLGDNAQAYAMFTYYQNRTSHQSENYGIRSQSNSGDVSTATIVAPPTLPDGSLNPNDPYAADGDYARLYYRFPDYTTKTLSQTYRGAAGINGSFGDGWNYNVDGVYMRSNLKQTYIGVPYFQGVIDAVANGTYNFVDPSQNSQAVLDQVMPTNVGNAHTTMAEIEGTLTKKFFELPGGPLQVAVGGAFRHETLDDPSANFDDENNPTEQFYPGINAFGAIGKRSISSGFFEIDAPILKMLSLNGGGRYDHYSTGVGHFSPKIQAQFKPIKEVSFRGTFSKGFTIPSFAETNTLPPGVTGFANSGPLPADFVNQHLVDAAGNPVPAGTPGAKADDYAQPYLVGATYSANPKLKPETSTSYSLGAVVQPVRWFNFTVDYYHIKKKNIVQIGGLPTVVLDKLLTGQAVPGVDPVYDTIGDPNHPGALPQLLTAVLPFQNANSYTTSGIDVEASAQFRLSQNLKFTTNFSGTYVFKFNEDIPGLGIERFAGSLGPCNTVSCSGTPKFRASWENTLESGPYSLTATAYYTSGYKTTAEDVAGPGTINDCSTVSVTFDDGVTPIQCHVKRFIDVDMTASVKVAKNFKFYINVINLFDAKPPVDLVTYGQNGYNPAWSEAGIVGRFFRVGVNVDF